MKDHATRCPALDPSRDVGAARCTPRVLAIVLLGSLVAGPVAAMPPLLTAMQLDTFCRSDTVVEATERADRLGWQRASDRRLAGWRAAFLANDGGTVEVRGWTRTEGEGDGLLSFWVARGPNAHRACSYLVGDATGVLDGLTDLLGSPGALDRLAFGTTAYWNLGATEVSFAQVGVTVTVSYVHREAGR